MTEPSCNHTSWPRLLDSRQLINLIKEEFALIMSTRAGKPIHPCDNLVSAFSSILRASHHRVLSRPALFR